MHSTCFFEPFQIVCLEGGSEPLCSAHLERLYAEVIQTIDTRQLVWVRPLMLVVETQANLEPKVYDLRQGADLLWPIKSFRPALDTEAIALLAQLESSKPDPACSASHQLKAFMEKVWQTHQKDFRFSS